MKITYNLEMDKYIDGIKDELLYGDHEITAEDIKFKQKPTKEIEDEILILLNDIREINNDAEEENQ